MRFMIIVKASHDSEAGVMPSEQLLTDMGNYNEQLAKAGILVSADGLHPSSKAARVRFSGENRSVIDGPFAETKELIAGYWIWDVKSKEEAIDGSSVARIPCRALNRKSRFARCSARKISAPSSPRNCVSRKNAYASKPKNTEAPNRARQHFP